MSEPTPRQAEPHSSVRDEVRSPSMFKVLLHNDDYTTMEFVVEILRKVFNKPPSVATDIMLSVHNTGVGLCGVYTAEIAETRVEMVHTLAHKAGFPLRCSIEEA